MNYDSAIITALKNATGPLTMHELWVALDPDNKDWTSFNAIGLALTRLHRNEVVARERIRRDGTQRRYYAYTLEVS